MTRDDILAACAGGLAFTADMAQAVADGRKKRTMRVIKDFPGEACPMCGCEDTAPYPAVDLDNAGKVRLTGDWRVGCPDCGAYAEIEKPKYKPGDIVFVREPWSLGDSEKLWTPIYEGAGDTDPADGAWRSAEAMEIADARTFLRITGVCQAKLQDDILEPIAPILKLKEEGIDIGNHCRDCINNYGEPCCAELVDEDGSTLETCGILDEVISIFSDLWDKIYREKPYQWKENPWCWVYEFERVEVIL
jgi:hypothetical protein